LTQIAKMLIAFFVLLALPEVLLTAAHKIGARSSSSHSKSEDHIEPYLPLEVLCEVNGFIIPAMIDTGAQISIMSEACAQRCMLSNQIDACYGGRAVGVGVSEIIGRINNLPLRIGPVSFHNKISILKNSRVDFIIGLDFLRKHKCELSIMDNSLRIHVQNRNFRIPFVHDYYDEQLSHSLEQRESFNKGEYESDSEMEGSGKVEHIYAYKNDDEDVNTPPESLTSTFSNWDEYDDSNEEFVSMEGL
jgi:hypothetical protein